MLFVITRRLCYEYAFFLQVVVYTIYFWNLVFDTSSWYEDLKVLELPT
jgi:hypothetical protein